MPNPSITKRALAACMKELMETHPLSKINVGDIVEHCGLSRNSFYYHFKDKYDLVNWIFYTDIIDTFGETAEDEDESNWESIGKLCSFFYDNKTFYMNALSVDGQNSFSEYFTDLLKELILTNADGMFEDDKDRDFFATFFADSILTALFRWIREGAKIPPDEFTQLLRKASTGAALRVLQDYDVPDLDSSILSQ